MKIINKEPSLPIVRLRFIKQGDCFRRCNDKNNTTWLRGLQPRPEGYINVTRLADGKQESHDHDTEVVAVKATVHIEP